MTLQQQIITVAMVVFATILTRFIPFILLPKGSATPPYVNYLGKVLPGAIFALLVVYSLRNVTPLSGTHGAPEAIGVLVTVALHMWKKQMLLSIAGGTITYMILIQFVFV